MAFAQLQLQLLPVSGTPPIQGALVDVLLLLYLFDDHILCIPCGTVEDPPPKPCAVPDTLIRYVDCLYISLSRASHGLAVTFTTSTFTP